MVYLYKVHMVCEMISQAHGMEMVVAFEFTNNITVALCFRTRIQSVSNVCAGNAQTSPLVPQTVCIHHLLTAC